MLLSKYSPEYYWASEHPSSNFACIPLADQLPSTNDKLHNLNLDFHNFMMLIDVKMIEKNKDL